MSIDDYVNITISVNSLGVQRAGFGVPMIMSYKSNFPERARAYSDLAGIVADGFLATDVEYLTAAALLSQDNQPEQFIIGRGTLAPTQVYEFTPTASDNTVYTIQVEGEGVTSTLCSYTSDATATVAEITAGLHALLNAVVGKNFTSVDNTTSLTITADAAGNWFSLEVGNPDLMKIEQTHVDPGIATDLAAIELFNSDWYGLCTNYNSNAMVLAADTWVSTLTKLYLFDVNETDAITTAAGNSDTLDDIATLARARTSGWYHPSPAAMLAASMYGDALPLEPGTETWALRQLSGVAPVSFTTTHRNNLLARNANGYETRKGVNVTFFGTTGDGDFIDAQRNLDWLKDDMGSGTFQALAAAQKVPYTDDGVSVIHSEMLASLERGIARGILSPSPAPVVQVPKVANIDAADKTARLLPDMKFSATLAGAIHKVNIVGTLSV